MCWSTQTTRGLFERLASPICARCARDEGIIVEEAERVFVDDMMLKRLGDPGDVGALAAFMVSARAGFMTGSMVSVDGGMHPTT